MQARYARWRERGSFRNSSIVGSTISLTYFAGVIGRTSVVLEMQVLLLWVKVEADNTINGSRIVSGNLNLQFKSSSLTEQVGEVIGRPDYAKLQNRGLH